MRPFPNRSIVALTFPALSLLALTACDDRQPTRTIVAAKDVMVVTDGRFNEWGNLPLVFVDREDAGRDAAVDLGEVRAADDSRWLHLAVDVGRTVSVERMRGTLQILFDADGDSSTGAEVFAMEGVDLIVELSRRDPGAEVGAGSGVRPVTAAGPGELLSGYRLGLFSAPTHSASRFEIRLDRGKKLEGLPVLFAGKTFRLKLVFEDAEGVRDETGVALYQWANPAGGEEPQLAEPWVDRSGSGFRVVYWNLDGETFRREPEPFGRILAALDPDVILISEVYESATQEELEAFFAADPLGPSGDWRLVLGGGGRRMTVVASRRPIRPAAELGDLAYPPGALDRLAEKVDSEFREVLELERGRGVAAAGAWIDVGGGREALFVAVDLESGGYDGSPEDRLRELQAATLRERIGSVLDASDGPLPLVVGGGLNLVGSVRPLDQLRQGLDAGGAIDLSVCEAYRSTDRSQATWRDPEGGAFAPARLDYLLFTASTLESVRAFVFDAAELSAKQSERLGLVSGDSEVAAHLPGVADFRRSRARQ